MLSYRGQIKQTQQQKETPTNTMKLYMKMKNETIRKRKMDVLNKGKRWALNEEHEGH